MKTTTFKINYYLSLKLEHGHTQIYVKNKCFNTCKYLLFDLNLNELESYDKIKSIDDLVVKEQQNSIRIKPHQEFWGHCSNLQAWYENNYDTRLLHRNLAFPLLNALSKAGDPKAKRVFKEEIAERFLTGTPNVMEFLLREGYLNYLNKEEYQSLLHEIKDHALSNVLIYNNRIVGVVYKETIDLDDLGIADLEKIPTISLCSCLIPSSSHNG